MKIQPFLKKWTKFPESSSDYNLSAVNSKEIEFECFLIAFIKKATDCIYNDANLYSNRYCKQFESF